MTSDQIQDFERILDDVIEKSYTRRTDALQRSSASVPGVWPITWRSVAGVCVILPLLPLLVFAPLWIPFRDNSAAALTPIGVVVVTGALCTSIVYGNNDIRRTLWGWRAYPLALTYDWCARELIYRCAQRGMSRAEVKYLFALSKADRGLTVGGLEAVWKYGGSAAFLVLVGAQGPPIIKIPVLIGAFAAARFVLYRVIDPSLRRSMIAASIEHHCK